ncbi:putative Ig domain-containing protein [Actinoplanes sp. LDG1-06]|uniref:Ig domain-containing protein n=1 Tax=Paractinoplanes ovalisporus TaxID=2810368 RepID=A0ABS2AU30_9ACTN|nr:putative Ig domain-containing protein [Actinoplanes ovalisporus]MBM2623372.1 putative Ig domain-containing protein [Actinoplanes ovalisporus]
MIRKPWRAGALVLATVAATAVAVLPADAGGPRSGAIYVALGDSYASGEGLGPFEAGTDTPNGAKTNMCHRSKVDAYAVKVVNGKYLVRPGVKATERAFWACSGATTESMTKVGDKTHYQQPKQVPDTVGANTRWISLSAGGNNVQFAKLVEACLLGYTAGSARPSVVRLPARPLCDAQLKTSSGRVKALGGSLKPLYESLLKQAPKAKLVVVGYPRVFPASMTSGVSLSGLTAAQRTAAGIPSDASRLCRTNLPDLGYWIGVDDSHAKQLTAFSQDLNRIAFQQVNALARTYPGRIAFADTFSTSVPHSCTGLTRDPSVNGIRLSVQGAGACAPFCGPVSEASFHPTRAGADRFGKVVEAAFGGDFSSLSKSWKVTGKAGEPLKATPFLYSGGTGTVSVVPGVDGKIPPWLTLGASAGAITLGGTPSTGGTWTFPITVQDSAKHVLTITVTLTVSSGTSVGLGKVIANLGGDATPVGFSPTKPLFAYFTKPADGVCNLNILNTSTNADDLIATMQTCGNAEWSADGASFLHTRYEASARRIFVWDTTKRASSEVAPAVKKLNASVQAPQISADGRFVSFTGYENATAVGRFVFDRQSSKAALAQRGETRSYEQWASAGHRIVAADMTNSETGSSTVCTGVAPACDQILWPDNNGNLTVTGDREGRVAVTNTAAAQVKVFGADGDVTTAPAAVQDAVGWGAGGNLIGTGAFATVDRPIYRWNTRTGALTELGRLRDKGRVLISPDAVRILVTGGSPVISIDVATAAITDTPLRDDYVQWDRTSTRVFSGPSFNRGAQIWTSGTNTVSTLAPSYTCFFGFGGSSASGRYALVADSPYCGGNPTYEGWLQFVDLTTGKVVSQVREEFMPMIGSVDVWSPQGDVAWIYHYPTAGSDAHSLLLVTPQG